MSEKLEYADFLESGTYVKKLEETYNRYLDVRDKKIVEFMKENERLHSIIKEVREYIENNKQYAELEDYEKNGEYYIDEIGLLEILDKVDKENKND